MTTEKRNAIIKNVLLTEAARLRMDLDHLMLPSMGLKSRVFMKVLEIFHNSEEPAKAAKTS